MKKEVDDTHTQYDELSVNMDQSEREGYKKSVLLFRNYVAEVYNFKTKEWTKTNLKFPENIEIIGVCQLGSLLVSVGLDSSDARKKFMPLILYKLDIGKWTEVKKIQNIDYSQKLEFMSMIPSSIHRILILFKRSVTAVDIDSNGLSIHTQVYSDPDFLTRYSELKEFSAKSFKGAIYIIEETNNERKVLSKVSPLYSKSEEITEMNTKRQGAQWFSYVAVPTPHHQEHQGGLLPRDQPLDRHCHQVHVQRQNWSLGRFCDEELRFIVL